MGICNISSTMRFPVTCTVFIHRNITLPSAIYVRINQPVTNSSLFLHGCFSKALVSPGIGHSYMVLCTVPGPSITIVSVFISERFGHLPSSNSLSGQNWVSSVRFYHHTLSETSNQRCQGNYISTVLLASHSLPAHATGLWSDHRRSLLTVCLGFYLPLSSVLSPWLPRSPKKEKITANACNVLGK